MAGSEAAARCGMAIPGFGMAWTVTLARGETLSDAGRPVERGCGCP